MAALRGRGSSIGVLFGVDAVFADLVPEDALGGFEGAGGGGHVAACGFEGVGDEVAFVGFDEAFEAALWGGAELFGGLEGEGGR